MARSNHSNLQPRSPPAPFRYRANVNCAQAQCTAASAVGCDTAATSVRRLTNSFVYPKPQGEEPAQNPVISINRANYAPFYETHLPLLLPPLGLGGLVDFPACFVEKV